MTDKKSKLSKLKILLPPQNWKLPASIAVGVLCGIIITLFFISNASSYISNDPRACINCHVMSPHYATWMHSSHREHAVCNDCHVPHDNFFRKLYFKANDGLRHATIFTMRAEPQVIKIKEAGIAVVQQNCLRCHMNQVHPVSAANVSGENYKHGEGKLCWSCHRTVPHGRVRSEASTPNAIIPPLKPVIPEWLRKERNNSKIKFGSKDE